MISDKVITIDRLQRLLNANSRDGYEFQRRKQTDWKENYELYRDKVITNRLTQRQSTNIPLMKQVVKTLLSKIDDFVDLQFVNLDSDKQKELFFNLYWSDVVVEDNQLVLKDMVDKKQVMLFGRSFEKLNIMGGKFKFHIIDPADMRVDRYIDPTNIDSARYLIQDNIFESLGDLKANPMYDQAQVAKMETFFQDDRGLVLSGENQEQYIRKNDAMRDMGDNYVDYPLIGQTIVQCQEGFIKVFNHEINEEEIIFTFSGNIKTEDGENQSLILFAESLDTLIDPSNKTNHFWRSHYPFESWGEDVENRDFWCDGVADAVRVPNKIVNSWFSQTVENRTLRNFGMNYYNSTLSGEDGAFIPQTFEPKAWGWYPIPGNPNDLIKSVEIPELQGNLEEINFVVQVAEKASAATAITQGVAETKRITLGEVQLLAGNALDRIQSMSKFYQQAWLNIGRKYVKMVEAMGSDIEAVQIFKKGRNTDAIFTKTISYDTWKSKAGYATKVISKKDKSVQDLEEINKLNGIKSFMPMNMTLNNIIKEKLLDIGNLTPDQVKQIMEEDARTPQMPGIGGQPPVSTTPMMNIPGKPQPATKPLPTMIPGG